jgi:hypothetical protein
MAHEEVQANWAKTACAGAAQKASRNCLQMTPCISPSGKS